MQRVITSKVDRHHTNQGYQCLVYDLLREPTFHFRLVCGNLVKADWMPKEDDVLAICEDLLRVSPTFGAKLLELAMAIPEPITTSKPKRTLSMKSNIAEILL